MADEATLRQSHSCPLTTALNPGRRRDCDYFYHSCLTWSTHSLYLVILCMDRPPYSSRLSTVIHLYSPWRKTRLVAKGLLVLGC